MQWFLLDNIAMILVRYFLNLFLHRQQVELSFLVQTALIYISKFKLTLFNTFNSKHINEVKTVKTLDYILHPLTFQFWLFCYDIYPGCDCHWGYSVRPTITGTSALYFVSPRWTVKATTLVTRRRGPKSVTRGGRVRTAPVPQSKRETVSVSLLFRVFLASK